MKKRQLINSKNDMNKFENGLIPPQPKNENIEEDKSANLIEKPEKDEELELDESKKLKTETILKRIRDNAAALAIGLSAISLTSLNMLSYFGKNKESKNETTQEKINSGKPEFSKFFNDDFISEVALAQKNDFYLQNKYFYEYLLYGQGGGDSGSLNQEELTKCNNQLEDYEKKINLEKQKLTENDKKTAKEKITDLVLLTEQAKSDVIDHIGSDEYLKKLAKEMNISEREAKEQQQTKLKNLQNISYDFRNSGLIFQLTRKTSSEGAVAMHMSQNNEILLPYNIDLKDEKEKRNFYAIIQHEMLHGSANSDEKMSSKANNLLTESFQSSYVEKGDNYFTPSELIVRKQVLDLEMEKLGIKKYGEEFTNKHYQELLDLAAKDKLSSNALELIWFIKSNNFLKIMNELAENNNKKDFYNPDWNYNQPEPKA
ncbi:MAG: hypothetical protein ACYC40_02935 [Patescibacteria group bacterium]